MSPSVKDSMGSSLPCFLVTGGAGFIGSNFVLSVLAAGAARVVTLDKLTYAGNLDNLALVAGDPAHRFVHGDIADRPLVARLCAEHRPRAIVNFAAESHVDRSIDGPGDFIRTNVVGTFHLLEVARAFVASLPAAVAARFRFLHVSTDEVTAPWPVGSLHRGDALRSQLALRCVEGERRSPRARLPHDVRPARDHDQGAVELRAREPAARRARDPDAADRRGAARRDGPLRGGGARGAR